MSLLAAAACALAGCSGVKHLPVPPGNESGVRGIRYYQTSMYLLVYPNGKGGLGYEVLELPDPTRKMAAQPYSVLSTLDTEMTFTNGGLSASKEVADSSKIPAAIVAAVGKFLPAMLAAHAVKKDSSPELAIPAPRLYKILIYGGQVHFEGEQTDIPVHMTLAKPTKTGG